MEKIELSPALREFTLDSNQKSPIMSIVGLGEIDLRTVSEYQVQRMKDLGISIPCLKPTKKTATPAIQG